MTVNSVTGSFRGIDVSFAYKGPHIVMSVMNNKQDGRRLRVMFQQQPLSGRVNWVSFQLTRQVQDVVVPAEVIHSHKLAFYVDNHEPIATYTEKILDELKQIQERQISENHTENSTDDSAEQDNDDINDVHLAEQDQNDDNVENDANMETQELQNGTDISSLEEEENDTSESIQRVSDEIDIDQTNLESLNRDAILSSNGKENSHQQKVVENNSDKEKHEKVSKTLVSDLDHRHTPVAKAQKQIIDKYVPSVSNELQFKIRVPTLPKSANQMHTTFIPPRNAFSSRANVKKNSFFGRLAGTFAFTFSNRKKEYYARQHRHLYEKFHADLEKLESDYNNGCGISLDNWDLESLNEEETAVLILNLMVNEISTWKKIAKKREATKDTLVKSLQNIEDELKYTLKQTRGMQAPAPTLFPDRTAMTDQDLMNFQTDCDIHLRRFSEKLASLEQKHAEKVRIPVFKKFLLEFVRDKLFPHVAEFSDLPSVQKRLNWFLDLVDYEIIPIEPGKTKISHEHHDVKEKRNCDLETDTVAEVIKPGIQKKDSKRVIQNAVVIQAE